MADRSVGDVLVGVLAIGLGLWDAMACFVALGALSGDTEVPDSPLFSAAQNRAVQDMAASVAVYEPVNGAIAALVTLVGPLLLAAGFLLLARAPLGPLVARVAFGASLAVDALQAVWSVVWYILVWEPMSDYVRSIARSMPDQPSGGPESLDTVIGLAISVTALLGLGYYAVKVGLALWGLSRTGRMDRAEPEPAFTPPRDEGLDWADGPPSARS